MAKLSEARKRGIYPETIEPQRPGPVTTVTVKIPTGIWYWLKRVVGRDSFTFCVEETIITALRAMAGRDYMHGLNGETLVDLISTERGVTAAEALYGPLEGERLAVSNLLLEASQMAARGVEEAAVNGVSERLSAVWSAAAGRNIGVEIEALSREIAEEEEWPEKTMTIPDGPIPL